MLLKSSRPAVVPHRLRALRGRWGLLLKMMVGLSVCVLLLGAGVRFGIFLENNSRASFTFRSWGLSLLKYRLGFVSHYVRSLTAQPERIDIDIKHRHFARLAAKRDEALAAGQLLAGDDDWVPARIRHNDRVLKVDMRLKGDLPDHWEAADGWSYKVKVENGETFLGMRRFALQSAWTRGFLNEWAMHRLLEHVGLIGMRYDFIDVSINGKPQSVYAIEENFDKLLIENNRRREGPILRFDAEQLSWNASPLPPDVFLHTRVSAYQADRLQADPVLRQQYLTALSLLERFRAGHLSVGEVFDLDRLALFFACFDLLGYHHATHLDNMKLYYNPITGRCEPIGYDNHYLMPLDALQGLYGAYRQLHLTDDSIAPPRGWYEALFQDREFYTAYVQALERISQPQFLTAFKDSVQQQYEQKLAILYRSYPWYYFEGWEIMAQNQQAIRALLEPAGGAEGYIESHENDQLTLQVRNTHCMPVELESVTMAGHPVKESPQPLILQSRPRHATSPYQKVTMVVDAAGLPDLQNLKITWRVLGATRSYVQSIHAHPSGIEPAAEQDILRTASTMERFGFIEQDPDARTIRIPAGHYALGESLVVPAGWTFLCEPGAVIDLCDQAMIISRSPLKWLGTADRPIRLISSDQGGQGLFVTDAQGPSICEYVIFEGLDAPHQAGWLLTGAVTFHESPVRFDHCEFLRGRSEDTLNIVRSTFDIEQSIFYDTAADALDADFCEGNLTAVAFTNCGNDAVDVSGTLLRMQGVSIVNSGDKGISAGEQSTVIAREVVIRQTEIAVACKDQSRIDWTLGQIIDCRVGFAPYQKKSEFGPAQIVTQAVTLTQIEQPYLVEQKSSLTMDGAQIPANRRNIKDLFYGVEYGKSSTALSL